MPMLRHIFEQQCNYTLTFEKTIDDLRREKFDVMIAETFDYCGIGIVLPLQIRFPLIRGCACCVPLTSCSITPL